MDIEDPSNADSVRGVDPVSDSSPWPMPQTPAPPPPIDVPPPPVDLPETPAAKQRRVPLWGKFGIAFSILLVIVVAAGFVIHVPYSTISPGSAVSLANRVNVDGARTYPDKAGDIRLLFVRERNHVNVWRYLQAKLDDDVDIFKEQVLNPDNKSQTQLQDEGAQQMADAKTAATVVALQAAGFKVTTDPGLTVSDIYTNLPAAKVMKLGDVITAANGHKVRNGKDLTDVIKGSKAGAEVTLTITRKGNQQQVRVGVAEVAGRRVVGVLVSPRFHFPFKVNVDTTGIGGPSAGLAMTLAILDDITPGNLTGGKRIAVTGTIDPQGGVGEIGGINQKAVAARASGAQVFIVPRCSPDDPKDALAACQKDLQRAIQRAGKNVQVIPVSTFAEALNALRSVGGDAVTPVTSAPRAA